MSAQDGNAACGDPKCPCRQLAWLEEMESIEQEVFPEARPRSEVGVEVASGGVRYKKQPDGKRWMVIDPFGYAALRNVTEQQAALYVSRANALLSKITTRSNAAANVSLELCALCTPERDHNGVLCRRHANRELAILRNRLGIIEDAARRVLRVLDIYGEGKFAECDDLREVLDGR